MAGERRGLPVLLLAVLSVFTAQQALSPVFAPLAREVGLTEIALGTVLTTGAVVFATTALFWGRAVDRLGRRRVLLVGIGLSLAGLAGFALVSQLALNGALTPGATLAAMIATRSLLFGAGLGAVPVAAMALVAATTADEAARTRGIGRIGAVQGVAIALGPALGGLLGFAGLLGPVWAAPAVVAAGLVLVALVLPAPLARSAEATGPRKPRATLRPWDPRLWPVLLGGFGLFLALSMILIVLGFLVQDRLGLDAAATVSATGAASFASGVVLILMQGVVVPWLRWPAARLLRVGAPIAAAGALALVFATELWSITVVLAGMAVGIGLAAPGYATAPTLLVGPDEQGSVAGLAQAVTGLTFVIGPVGGTALYGLAPEYPLVTAAAACGAATLFLWLHPALRVPTRLALPSRGSSLTATAAPSGRCTAPEPGQRRRRR